MSKCPTCRKRRQLVDVAGDVNEVVLVLPENHSISVDVTPQFHSGHDAERWPEPKIERQLRVKVPKGKGRAMFHHEPIEHDRTLGWQEVKLIDDDDAESFWVATVPKDVRTVVFEREGEPPLRVRNRGYQEQGDLIFEQVWDVAIPVEIDLVRVESDTAGEEFETFAVRHPKDGAADDDDEDDDDDDDDVTGTLELVISDVPYNTVLRGLTLSHPDNKHVTSVDLEDPLPPKTRRIKREEWEPSAPGSISDQNEKRYAEEEAQKKAAALAAAPAPMVSGATSAYRRGSGQGVASVPDDDDDDGTGNLG